MMIAVPEIAVTWTPRADKLRRGEEDFHPTWQILSDWETAVGVTEESFGKTFEFRPGRQPNSEGSEAAVLTP